MDLINYSQYMFGLVVIALLLALFAWGMKKLATSDMLANFAPHKGKRLSIVETLVVDPKRRLVLVQHDDKEHLLLVGGNTDLVIDGDYAPDPNAAKTLSAQNTPERPTD